MPATTAEKLNRLFAGANSSELTEALLELDRKTRTRDENWARVRIIEEIKRRYPAAERAVALAFDAAKVDEDVDYVQVLVDALKDC